MSEPKVSRAEIAAQISEMAAAIYGVPQDAFGRETADGCARMLQVLSGVAVAPGDEPFLPPLPEAAPGAVAP